MTHGRSSTLRIYSASSPSNAFFLWQIKDVRRPSDGETEPFISAILEAVEILKRILAVLEDRLPRATRLISPDPSGKKRPGRPPTDFELLLYAAFVDLAAPRGYTTDEALNSKIREVANKCRLYPSSKETLKKRLRALRQRMPPLL